MSEKFAALQMVFTSHDYSELIYPNSLVNRKILKNTESTPRDLHDDGIGLTSLTYSVGHGENS